MIAYQPFQGNRAVYPARKLGQENGQPLSANQVKSIGTLIGVGGMALGAATAYVGVTTGMKEKGFYSVLGWIVGATGGIKALVDTIGTISLLATSPEEIAAAIRKERIPQTTQSFEI